MSFGLRDSLFGGEITNGVLEPFTEPGIRIPLAFIRRFSFCLRSWISGVNIFTLRKSQGEVLNGVAKCPESPPPYVAPPQRWEKDWEGIHENKTWLASSSLGEMDKKETDLRGKGILCGYFLALHFVFVQYIHTDP